MPKTVDKYVIEKSLFQDDFLGNSLRNQVQYLSCQHKILKKNFTMKKIDNPSQSPNIGHQKQNNFILSYTCACFENQVVISRQLKSQRIIKCQKILKSKNSIFAIYDEHPQKTLHKVISTQFLTIQRKQNILSDILQLVLQMHQANIAIGNLCPKNIFLTQDYKIKISDFLIARKVQGDECVRIDNFFSNANSQYYAPQLIKTGNLSKAADIYSLGQIIKSLEFQKSQHELLSPGKSFFDNLKNFIDKMVDLDPQKRPLILELKNNLRLNQCKKSSIIIDFNEQKTTDSKTFGFQSFRSEVSLKSPDKIAPLQLKHYEVRKMMVKKKLTLDENQSYHSPRNKTYLNYKTTIDVDDLQQHQKTHQNFLQVPETHQSRQINSPLSQKSVISSTETSDSKRIVTLREKVQQVILIRNAVSLLLQMIQFVYDQNEAKQLVRCLIHEALGYVDSSIKSIGLLVGEEGMDNDFLKKTLEKSKAEKKKLMEISSFFNQGAEFKKQDQPLYCWQLKRFAKHMLDLHSSQFSLLANTSQLSTSSSRIRPSHKLPSQQPKQLEQKLFKTVLLLKRIQFGSYYQLMKARMHHFDRKFWKQHYFELQRTFGSKYFVIQIKDLMNRK